MLRLSTGLRAYLLNHGSLAEALSGGVIYVYSGTQPGSADTGTADTGESETLIATITDSDGAYTREQPVTATLTLTAGAAGSVDSVTVGGVELLEAAVPFNTSLAQTATDLAAAINRNRYGVHGIYATDDGAAEVTLTSKRTWGPALSAAAVVISTTTLSASKTDFTTIAATPANGLHFEKHDEDEYGDPRAKLIKASGQTWSGTAGASGTATWFRFTNHYLTSSTADDGTVTSTEVLRLDGSIGLANATLVLDDVEIESSDPVTVSSFAITATAMRTSASALRMTTVLINYVLNFGSLAEALTGADMQICSDAQPASAADLMETQLVQITDTGGAYQNEEMEVSGAIAFSGTAGSINDVTVNGTSLLPAPVAFNTSLGQTLSDLLAALRSASFDNHGLKFQVFSSTLVMNTLRTWSGVWAGGTVGVDVTTLGGTATNFGTVTNTQAAGLRFDGINATRLDKLPAQAWSGTAAYAGTAAWFRLRNHYMESNSVDADAAGGDALLRMDGNIDTAGALLNLPVVAITTSAAVEVNPFSIDATAAP